MEITPEVSVKLNKFKPRWYQARLMDALENKGYKKLLYILPRRCLDGNTHILLENGEYELLSKLSVGTKIISWNPEGFYEVDTIKDKWSTGKKDCFNVSTLHNPSLSVTEDHKFATRTRHKHSLKWRTINEMSSHYTLSYTGHMSDPVEAIRAMLTNFKHVKVEYITRTFFATPHAFKIIIELDDLYRWYWKLRSVGIMPLIKDGKLIITDTEDLVHFIDAGVVVDNIKMANWARYKGKQRNKWRGTRATQAIIQFDAERETYDIETEKNHNFIANGFIVHNSGKDIVCWNVAVRQCLKKVCTVFYMLPTTSQAKKVIWTSITNQGERFIDFIPKELIKSKNEADMSITFRNGSVLQLVGSENYDRLVGTNPTGIVFSEFGVSSKSAEAYYLLRPIVLGNQGWMIFASTPRGRNFMYQMYNVAKEADDWFVQHLTVKDTQHISEFDIQKELAEGLISPARVRQEYYCEFIGVEGSIYGKYIDEAHVDGRITILSHEPGHPVYTAWDIGRDCTSIVFYQVIGNVINIIDYYQKTQENLEHFVRIIEQKGYRYGMHFFPHDMSVTEWGGAKITRLDKFKSLYNMPAKLVPNVPLEDGIEHVRANFHKCWFDERKCADLLRGLENYQREFDADRKVYNSKPLHNFASHPSDAFRYALLSIRLIANKNSSAEELNKRYHEAVYGEPNRHW